MHAFGRGTNNLPPTKFINQRPQLCIYTPNALLVVREHAPLSRCAPHALNQTLLVLITINRTRYHPLQWRRAEKSLSPIVARKPQHVLRQQNILVLVYAGSVEPCAEAEALLRRWENTVQDDVAPEKDRAIHKRGYFHRRGEEGRQDQFPPVTTLPPLVEVDYAGHLSSAGRAGVVIMPVSVGK